MEQIRKRPFDHTNHDYQQSITKIPCRGYCKKANLAVNMELDRVYSYMAAVCATLKGGLTLIFNNTTGDAVDLIQRDDDGTESPIIRIKPERSKRIVAKDCHNFICRNTKLGHCYLLNSEYLIIGKALLEIGKEHTVNITPSKCPMSLRNCAINATAETIRRPNEAFKLRAPHSLQKDVYYCKLYSTERRQYWLRDDKPGYNSCKASNTGPWSYPEGHDWTVEFP